MKPKDLAQKLDRDFRICCGQMNHDQPWYGHITLVVDGQQREYKFGDLRSTPLSILDWRHSLATAYFDPKIGQDYQSDDDDPGISGTLVNRTAVETKNRRIHRLDLLTEAGRRALVAQGESFVPETFADRPMGPPTGLPDVLALITPEQHRLITSSARRPVIIQGRAGSGKTTVALYRVSWLAYADQSLGVVPVDPAKVLIVMFNRSLVNFVEHTLRKLQIDGAVLDTFHGWALQEICRAYQGEIRVDTSDYQGKAKAVVLKKHVGMLAAIKAFVDGQEQRMLVWLEKRLEQYKAQSWLEQYRESDQPVVRRLVQLRADSRRSRDMARGIEKQRLEQITKIFHQAVLRMTRYKEELLNLLRDVELLRLHLGGVDDWDLVQLSSYQTELQGRGGADNKPGPYIAFEDFALLLHLIQLKNGGYPDQDHEQEPWLYDHLVIDEAQDFGAVELAVLLSSVRSRTGVTIAGDLNQKILPEAQFIGWEALCQELGVEGAQVTRLEVAHRSTAAIMAVASSVLSEPIPGGSGVKPVMTFVEDQEQGLDTIVDSIRTYSWEKPDCHICIVVRHAQDAAGVHRQLEQRLGRHGIKPRLAHNKDFVFGPGVTVTNMRQIKGLEFDYVFVVEPSDNNYPDSDEGRRYLYTTITRAKDRLDFVCLAKECTLLSQAMEQGLVEIREQVVEEVVFSEEEEQPF